MLVQPEEKFMIETSADRRIHSYFIEINRWIFSST